MNPPKGIQESFEKKINEREVESTEWGRAQSTLWLWIFEGMASVMSKGIRSLKQVVFSWSWVFQEKCVVEINREHSELSRVNFSLMSAAGS